MSLTQKAKKKPTSHSLKRTGQHHRSSKRYSSTYWPYLPMLLVVLFGMVLNLSWNVSRGLLGYATEMSTSSLLSLTNTERIQGGLGRLTSNSKLAQAAQAKANDMALRDYWSHVTPDGKQPWSFIIASGYEYQSAGENLAYGFDTSSETINGWMNSPDHRANIMKSNYKEVGFGVANSSNYQSNGEQTIVVAMYAEPLEVAPAPTASTPPAPTKTTTKASTAAKSAEAAPVEPPKSETPAPVPETPAIEKPTMTNTDSAKAVAKVTAPPSRESVEQEQKAQVLSTKEIARIDVMTRSNIQWASLAVSTVATISILGFVLRHGRMWKRYLAKGEQFIIKHPLLDTILVAIGVIGFVLTRASGFIQ